jgi:hypothetical protein
MFVAGLRCDHDEVGGFGLRDLHQCLIGWSDDQLDAYARTIAGRSLGFEPREPIRELGIAAWLTVDRVNEHDLAVTALRRERACHLEGTTRCL